MVSDPAIFLGKRRVDGRLKGDFGDSALERDADIGRGVHSADGLGRRMPDIKKPPERLAAVDTSAKVPL